MRMISRLRKRFKFWLFSRCPFFIGKFRYFGVRTYFPAGSHTFQRLCEYGIYEQDNLELIGKLIKPESFYFDVGANVGFMSIPILVRFSSVSVVSYEPSPNTKKYLQKTHSESAFTNRWEIVEAAVSNKMGEISFCKNEALFEAFDGIRDTGRGANAEMISVPTTTIDSEWKRLGQPDISVIKMDIEGGELSALQGARECMSFSRPHVLLEWNADNLRACSTDFRELLTFSEAMGYSILACPDLIPIPNSAVLRLYMMQTESFLLAPNSR